MHKLDRGPAPGCLRAYRPGRDDWGSVTDDHRAHLWQALEAMQGKRCAYCEAETPEYRRHIEHFIQRSRNSQVTFQWDNLFGSCNRMDTCGKNKDHLAGSYNPAELLKPDVDDPDDYLVFVYDGTIQVRQGLTEAQQRRARETLRVFNLDADYGPLRQMRKDAVAGYLQTAEELWSMIDDFPDDEWQQLLKSELAAVADQPFITTIRHILCRIAGAEQR